MRKILFFYDFQKEIHKTVNSGSAFALAVYHGIVQKRVKRPVNHGVSIYQKKFFHGLSSNFFTFAKLGVFFQSLLFFPKEKLIIIGKWSENPPSYL